MKKTIVRNVWLGLLGLWFVACLAMEGIIGVEFWKSGIDYTIVNAAHYMVDAMARYSTFYKYAFGAFIFFVVSMFFVLDED